MAINLAERRGGKAYRWKRYNARNTSHVFYKEYTRRGMPQPFRKRFMEIGVAVPRTQIVLRNCKSAGEQKGIQPGNPPSTKPRIKNRRNGKRGTPRMKRARLSTMGNLSRTTTKRYSRRACRRFHGYKTLSEYSSSKELRAGFAESFFQNI